MHSISKTLVLLLALFIHCTGSVQAAIQQQAARPDEGAKAKPIGKTERGDKEAVSAYLRIRRDLDGMALALETATVRLTPVSGKEDLVVDLVAAVHMADREYYRQLNRQFEKYDVVLYELVAPRGTRVPSGGRSADNPLALIQRVASLALDLDSQVEHVDYTRPNFVHADLSPEEMAETMRRRGEDGFTLFLGIMADFLRQHNLMRQETARREEVGGRDAPERPSDDAKPEPDLVAHLLDPDGTAKLKRTLAQQIVQGTGPEGALGSTLHRLFVTDRNEAALRVFQTELAKGNKRIAIFYGAAHMEDFEKRLSSEFRLKRQQEQWLTAWDLRGGKSAIERLLRLLEPPPH